jgi:hypothetical protein
MSSSINISLDIIPPIVKKTRKPKEHKGVDTESTVKEPKVKEPKVKEPKVKEPKVKEPKTKEPKVKEPKAKEPKAKEPKVKEPKVKEQEILSNDDDNENKIYKKRGRKPKGGKIVINPITITTNSMNEHNVILHLKCNQDDLKTALTLSTDEVIYQPIIQNVENYCFDNSSKLSFEPIDNNDINMNNNNSSYNQGLIIDNQNAIQDTNQGACEEKNQGTIQNTKQSTIIKNNDDEIKISNKVLCEKIKELTLNLHNNNLYNKKSDCFWCTFNFDNPPIYIPKYELSGKYFCYGCFCSPECATAFLFKEPIDTSTRFERYHHLNHIYCKIYDYKKNIKPAPDPYYTLNKYYGNLSIQEYRLLLKNERLLIVVEKPLSRVLPELHEDNDELSHSSKSVIYSNKFNLNKKKVQSKKDIIYENFNMK